MVDLNNIPLPYVIKDVVLFVPGVHNGTYYDQNEINETFRTTNWEDTKLRSLYLDHNDDYAIDPRRPWLGKMMDVGANVRDYAGSVKGIRLQDNKIIGDLSIVDKDTAVKLAYEDSKFAISPAGAFQEVKMNGGSRAKKFRLKNFAIVINPAIKQAYIPKTAEHSQQLNWYNFAMSAEGPSGETTKCGCNIKREEKPKKMDVDELKDDLLKAISTQMKAEIAPLSTAMGEVKKEVEDLKAAAVPPVPPQEVDPEEEARKKKLEEDAREKEAMKAENAKLQSKITEMEEAKSAEEVAAAKAKADAEEAETKPPVEKKPEEAQGAAAVPAENNDSHVNPDGVKLNRVSQADQEMADFICGLGTGI